MLYATVQGVPPRSMSDSAWAEYKERVLVAVDHSAELPSELFLPSFSVPISQEAASSVPAGSGHPALDVTPSLSTVVAFTLDATGALKHARIAASSLSDGADTSVLAIVEQAATAHDFPSLPAKVDSVDLYLIVESAEPAPGIHAAVIGELEVPVWQLSQPARLRRGPQPPEVTDLFGNSTSAERAAVMMVVDASGQVVTGTARFETGAFGAGRADPASQARVLERLPEVRFEPAVIGTCRVSEFVVQPFAPGDGKAPAR